MQQVTRPQKWVHSSPQRALGASLVEVMVSLTIGLFLIALIINSLLSLNRSFIYAEEMARVQESLRFARHQLIEPIQKAQYWQQLQPLITYSGSITANQSQTEQCVSGETSWAYQVAHPVFGLNNERADYQCVSASSFLQSDVLTLRFLHELLTNENPSHPFIRFTNNQSTVFAGRDQQFAINQLSGTMTQMRAVMSEAFYIGKTSRRCNGKVIPALYRKYLVDGLPKTEELVSGVERLELLFSVSSSSDNTTEQVVDASQVSDWQQVRAIHVYLVARSECELPGPATSRTFSLANTQLSFNDRFLRETSNFTIHF
ncbi:PilW family protein [Thalassotalea mangrovi]|uniref:Prepilin-type N-terminal cleavage/methylation domain-containing protein n=1 Tax=Thalassotalea mangrovi TaxID=2572245 RepID=A0A4U1B399_9GAMM|nr:PilW family protein [Thalassotalea mangrovi]TKB44251.1 hypothetical protein E8M12_12625 [Thalassotalea mangrovi]